MKKGEKITIMVTAFLVVGILSYAFIKKKQNKNTDLTDDVEFQALIKKIDKAAD